MIRFVWGERVGEWRYFGICDGRDGLWFIGMRRAEACYRAGQQP